MSTARANTTVQVTPTVTLTAPPPNLDGLAAALLRSSETQAATTQALVASLSGAREPAAGMPRSSGDASTWTNLALVAIIAHFIIER